MKSAEFLTDRHMWPHLVPMERQMLILSRKRDESIQISENVVVTVLQIRRSTVLIGIDAPRQIPVLRSELRKQISAATCDGRSIRSEVA